MRRLLLVLMVALVLVSAAACDRNTDTTDEPSSSGTTQQQSQPPSGSTIDPAELGDPTIVADGKTPEDHVKEYFDAYKEGRYEDAFELQPAENKVKQPKDEFVPLRKSMPISDYKVQPTREEGSSKMIDVSYDLGQMGSWISSWTFEKQGDDWIAVRYVASMGSIE